MNDYFTSDRQVSELSIKGNAGALLLFAELPAYKLEGNRFVESVSTEQKASDGVVETQIGDKIASNEETIGFNHRVGKRHVAHVAFADGHVDGVAAPDKPSARLLQDLTCLMCNGVDVPADSGKWASARSDHLN
jgi:prepilin-type processing-associated H-X9-DG protein